MSSYSDVSDNEQDLAKFEETERLILSLSDNNVPLSPTVQSQATPVASPRGNTDIASPMQNQGLDNVMLATILDSVQKLTKRMDTLEKGKKRKKKASSPCKSKRNKQDQPSTSTAGLDTSAHSVSTEETDSDDMDEDKTEDKAQDKADIFTDMAASFDNEEDWGPPVSKKLADLLENRFGSKLPDSKLKEKLAAYRIPSNCRKSMGVPKTNQEVFNAVPPFARKADVRMRNNQLSLTKAAVALTQCTDRLLKMRESVGNVTPEKVKEQTTACIANLADALALTGHACKNLSQKRREIHRPHLPPETAGICAPHIPMSAEWLYPEGSEFHKSLKEVRETRKLGQSMKGHSTRGRGQGHRWHQSTTHAHTSQHFLGYQPQGWKQGGYQGHYQSRKPWNQKKGHRGAKARN